MPKRASRKTSDRENERINEHESDDIEHVITEKEYVIKHEETDDSSGVRMRKEFTKQELIDDSPS